MVYCAVPVVNGCTRYLGQVGEEYGGRGSFNSGEEATGKLCVYRRIIFESADKTHS